MIRISLEPITAERAFVVRGGAEHEMGGAYSFAFTLLVDKDGVAEPRAVWNPDKLDTLPIAHALIPELRAIGVRVLRWHRRQEDGTMREVRFPLFRYSALPRDPARVEGARRCAPGTGSTTWDSRSSRKTSSIRSPSA